MLNDPTQPNVFLELKALIKTAIDILPQEQLFFQTFKGQGMQQELTIVNNETKPLSITKVDSSLKYVVTELQPLEKGKKYKLVVKALAQAPLGEYNGQVLVHTNHPKFSTLPVQIVWHVQGLVAAYPPTVQFGTLNLEAWESTSASQATRTLIVKRLMEDKNFKVEKVRSNSPFLKVAWQPTTLGNSKAYKITISLVKDKLQKNSPLNGSISVLTNDKEVPELKIPIVGNVL